ncbi:uncharacterized protein LOC102306591 [Haplochromis burtoni]|uniref:uncharacterized protein LOC102306591 n=1 Tax=Haplochromis burtoni TaxID=8153 RepID=UPI001C2DE471|nr:uncharacterized protein LOC102306591 [Haplochromis burtoni]
MSPQSGAPDVILALHPSSCVYAFSLFVVDRLPRQQQCEDGVCMKRRCFPLRGDHSLLTPDTHTLLGLRQCDQVQSGGVAPLSGGSSSSKPNTASARQRPAASPTRRLRFEDETEKEAESRYLERQRQKRQTGNCGVGVVMSKPDLNLYINGTAEAGHAVGKQPRGRTVVSRAGQNHTCERGIRCGVNLWQHSPGTEKRGSLNRQHLNLRTEPIRETYIGSVTSVEKDGAYTQVRRQSVELNGAQVTFHQAMPYAGLPTNPYAPHSMGLCTTHPPKLHREHQLGPEPRERRGREVEEDLNNMMKNSSSSSERSADTTAESHPPPTSEPMRAELHQLDVSLPPHLSSREDSSRLSLRRFFSTVTLSRTRTSSLDRLCSRTHERTHPSLTDSTSSISRNSSSLVKKTLSVESLSVVRT